MALIKCPECNKEISDTAKSCIHCGYKLKKFKPIHTYPFAKKIRPIIIALLIILGPIWLLTAIVNKQLWNETMEHYFNTIPSYNCNQFAKTSIKTEYLYNCSIKTGNYKEMACFKCSKNNILIFSRVHGCVLKSKSDCNSYILNKE